MKLCRFMVFFPDPIMAWTGAYHPFYAETFIKNGDSVIVVQRAFDVTSG